jgi:hypothetical protein
MTTSERRRDAQRPAGGLMRRTVASLAAAVPDFRTAAVGSVAWALAMGVAALAKLVYMDWYSPERMALISAFFAAGGLLAFMPGIFVGRLLSRGRRDAGLAATFLGLSTATVAFTAFLVALEYRSYYAEWHEAAFTVTWVFQFIFTVASAVYQFLVMGARIYFPVGLLFIMAAAIWNVRGMR